MSENEKQDAPAPEAATNGSEPKQENGNTQNGDAEKKHEGAVASKLAAAKEMVTEKKAKAKDKANPPGGFDDTPIPSASDGYTVKFTFHGAKDLPISDLNTGSSDPYCMASLTSPGIQPRHKEDPEMRLRTKTEHKTTNPEWNSVWIVAGIPSQGFRLKCRLYDEDSSDHDDRLGNVTIHVGAIGEGWAGMQKEEFNIKKRMGSKRAYLLRAFSTMCYKDVHMSGQLIVSMEVLGKSEKPYGRMYTVGETMWTKHFSPMIGRLAGTKNFETGEDGKPGKIERYE